MATRYDRTIAFETTKADDICHCGRLKRFARCCAQLDARDREARSRTLTLQVRSQLTVDAVRYFFDTGPAGASDEAERLKRNMTADRVAHFYRYLADLWPADLQAINSLDSLRANNQLSGFYVGWVRPEWTLRSVNRASLYADRILVEQPFHLPWMLRDEYDPIQNPNQMRPDTHRWATVMLLLEPWIRDGFVILVPAPDDYDSALREAFLASGLRRERDGLVNVHPDDFAQIEEVAKQEFFRGLNSLADDVIARRIKETGDFTDDQIPGMLSYIKSLRERDPFYLEGVMPEGGFLQKLSIPTIELTTLTCGLADAFPFTDLRGKWDELLKNVDAMPDDAAVWTPLSKAFSQLKFDFLDGYDSRLAYRMREDGRLLRFRSYLKDIWEKVHGSPDVDAAERYARDLTERLVVEYDAARAEWNLMRQRYATKVKKDALVYGFGGVGAAATSAFSGLLSEGLLGVVLSFGLYMFRAKEDAKMLEAEIATFRARVPLSLFIDIELQK